MPARLRIQGGSSSPFKVSASNVDADDTFALIFDGNQSPLRIVTHGQVAANRNAGNIAPAVFTQSAVGYTAPPGLFPLFALADYLPPLTAGGGIPAGGRARNPFLQQNTAPPPPGNGFGGALANGWFYGMNFTNLSSGVSTYNISFIIFRNMG